ncbi:ribosome biogenesis GTPase Der [Oleiharenicola lentus]|jgi:GTP-binding protein|uniref:GTPase Der n=1 Tax=Oleiharenicola lentus TaxID=2508720 RepID=A0A4Q1CB11_9BACT|nr:ribosome biogenesis GTPase Der [Oleiharenicola lentus]RXK56072.1 ribosome biogenesis GTPase Der [Oleiharenicola lentus]
MQNAPRTVAIVGRPNVGKSRLFNRLARKRISIVHDMPGVTRDVITAEVEDGGYTLLDTGGLGLTGSDTPARITKASEAQVGFAIEAASVILFVIDAREGVTGLDERIAQLLRKSRKHVLLVANKADRGQEKLADISEFYRLGFGEPFYISAEHGNGEAEVRNAVLEKLGPVQEETDEERARLHICFLGRPNVGKSSLSNRLLKSDRLIVSDVPGTTRDAVELDFSYTNKDGKPWLFRLVDTAGIRAAPKLSSSVEYFSRLRSLEAIHGSDVVFMVLDAMDGVTQQDKAIAGEIVKAQKPIVIVVNKWDLVHEAFRTHSPGMEKYKNARDFREKFEKAMFDQLFFTPGAPVMFVSALTGHEIDRMLRAARALDRRLDTKIPTARLNATLIKLADRTPPPAIGGQRFKIYYATQTSRRPFRIKVFCNQERTLTESYRRYLEAGLVKEFELDGCPIHFDLVGKKKVPIEQRLAYRKSKTGDGGTEEGGGEEMEFDPSMLDD